MDLGKLQATWIEARSLANNDIDAWSCDSARSFSRVVWSECGSRRQLSWLHQHQRIAQGRLHKPHTHQAIAWSYAGKDWTRNQFHRSESNTVQKGRSQHLLGTWAFQLHPSLVSRATDRQISLYLTCYYAAQYWLLGLWLTFASKCLLRLHHSVLRFLQRRQAILRDSHPEVLLTVRYWKCAKSSGK